MKIVDRKTFLSMPEGTVFSKYEPCVFDPFEIKGETLQTNDYCYQQINDSIKCSGSDEFADLLFLSEKTGQSLEMDFDIQGRDGCFDNDQLFAVWEKRDIEALIERLQICLSDYMDFDRQTAL